MEPIVDLAPGAEENPLAPRLAEIIRANLGIKPHKRKDFRALRGAVQIVPLDTGEPLTLRFDHGRLTIHDGQVGIPAVTIAGDTADVMRLADLPMTRLFRVPVALDRRGRAVLGEVLRGLQGKSLRIYGLWTRPVLVLRVLRVLSVNG